MGGCGCDVGVRVDLVYFSLNHTHTLTHPPIPTLTHPTPKDQYFPEYFL